MVLHAIGNRSPQGFPGSIPGSGVDFYLFPAKYKCLKRLLVPLYHE